MGDGLKDFHKLGELASSCSMIMSKLIAAQQHGGYAGSTRGMPTVAASTRDEGRDVRGSKRRAWRGPAQPQFTKIG